MKAVLILLTVTNTVFRLVSGNEVYTENPTQMSPHYSCADGDTPLGFQCISMTYPELTTDINDYPCFTVNNVTGRHIEVLIEPVNPIAQVRTCIREDGFSEQCANGVNNYCRRIQSSGDSTIIRVYCLSGGCETSPLSLWFRINLSPAGNDEENWCLTRSQDVPSSLSEFDQPINQTFDQPINQTFDQPINQTFDVNQNGTEPEPNMTATCTADQVTYMENPTEMSPDYSCAARDTPLGFQCIMMTSPGLTTDINDYPCFIVNDVTGRYIEVLIEPVNPMAQVRICIREDGFSEQCASGVNNYCKRIQSPNNSTIIRVYCLDGRCEPFPQLLWFRINLSPAGDGEENWCLTRSQDTPSSLNEPDMGGFNVLQPLSVTTFFLIVAIIKLIF